MILHTNRLLMFKMTVEHPHILRMNRHGYAQHHYGKYQWHTHDHISELDRDDNSILGISPIRSTARNLPSPAHNGSEGELKILRFAGAGELHELVALDHGSGLLV